MFGSSIKNTGSKIARRVATSPNVEKVTDDLFSSAVARKVEEVAKDTSESISKKYLKSAVARSQIRQVTPEEVKRRLKVRRDENSVGLAVGPSWRRYKKSLNTAHEQESGYGR